MKLSKILTAAGASLILIGSFTPAQATSTDVVLDLEGNPSCSSLGPNSEVLAYKDTSPTGGLVTMPTTDGGTQTLTYTVGTDAVGNAEVTNWRITGGTGVLNPINYTILKAQGGDGARVFHFGGDGALIDKNESAPGPKLSALSFCYGLTSGVGETSPVPSCEDLITEEETLDGTGIVCANDGKERLLINMELNAENFGFDDAFHACTCNVTKTDDMGAITPTGLPKCNPALSAVEKGSQETAPEETRSCMEYVVGDIPLEGDVPAGVNNKVPFVIQGVENPDSYICYIIDGVRECFGHY